MSTAEEHTLDFLSSAPTIRPALGGQNRAGARSFSSFIGEQTSVQRPQSRLESLADQPQPVASKKTASVRPGAGGAAVSASSSASTRRNPSVQARSSTSRRQQHLSERKTASSSSSKKHSKSVGHTSITVHSSSSSSSSGGDTVGSADNLNYDDPKAIEGWLKPRHKLKSKQTKKAFFASRIILLLLLQYTLYLLAWLFDRHVVQIPWNIIIVCGFVSLLFVPLSGMVLYKFGTVAPINYLFLCVYNVFSLPYFFALVKFIEDALVLQFFVHYGACLFVSLLLTLLAPRFATLSKLLLVCALLLVPLNWLLYALVEHVTVFTSITSSYIAFLCLAFMLYYIQYPPKCYNYTDYVVAFVHINLFTAFRTFRRAHMCLAFLLLFGLVITLVLEKLVLFAQWV